MSDWALSLDTRHRRLQALVAAIDAGGAGGTLALYATARPTSGATPASAPLVQLTLVYPCGSVTADSLIFADSEFRQIVSSGQALWGRISTSAGDWVADLDVVDDTEAYGYPVLRLLSAQLYAGAYLALIGAVLVDP